jgi:putative intracellular protease/amidase
LRAVIDGQAKLVVVPACAHTDQIIGGRPARYTGLVFAGGLYKRLAQSHNIRRAFEALKSWVSSAYGHAGTC